MPDYTRTPEQIVQLFTDRKRVQDANGHLERIAELDRLYHNVVAVPLPEMDRNEKTAVANLVTSTLDQTAMRVASTQPDARVPAIDQTKRAQKRASERRDIMRAWWDDNLLHLMDRRRARHLIGYAATPVAIRPGMWDKPSPRWQLLHPASTFPASTTNPDDLCPEDCVYAYKQTYGWLKSRYPESMRLLDKGGSPRNTDVFDVIEYIDAEQVTCIVLGRSPGQSDLYVPDSYRGSKFEVLESYDNRAETCLVVHPGRITLDRPQGQFDGIIGMYQLQAKLMALQVLAVQRGIFPEEWLIHRPNEVAEIIVQPDPRTGQVGEVKGGEIREVRVDPSFANLQMIDRLERGQRLGSWAPAEFGGEAQSTVRTGRRGEQIMSAVVDFPIQEAQELLAASREAEDKKAIAIAKKYTTKSVSLYSDATRGFVTYDQAKIREVFETDQHRVAYSHAGADVNSLTVGVGQLIGLELMSKRTGMESHPMIEDPETEFDRITDEGLFAALMAKVQQDANQGTISARNLARIRQWVRTNQKELDEAILAIDEEVRQEQATEVPPTAPEAMPGLEGGVDPGVTVQDTPPSLDNLAAMLRQGRTVQAAA